MHFASDAEVEAVARGLIDRTLPKSQWTHAAHFAAALWLMQSDAYDAFRDMPGMIRSYNEATGTPNSATEGYHETITQGSLRAARHFLGHTPAGQSLFETVNAVIASELGDPDWLLAYWSRDRLFSAAARAAWVGPDLEPLPYWGS